MTTYTITPATFPNDKQAITALFSAYTAALGLDLTYQDYSTELSSLPGKYSPDHGGILLVAREITNTTKKNNNNNSDNAQGQEIVGCVALRALPPGPSNSATEQQGKKYCEMKRLYICPSARGTGLGGRLIEALIQHARNTNLYHGIKLDTLPGEYMASARALYRRFGFEQVARYYETPVEGTIFMGLEF